MNSYCHLPAEYGTVHKGGGVQRSCKRQQALKERPKPKPHTAGRYGYGELEVGLYGNSEIKPGIQVYRKSLDDHHCGT